MTRFFTATERDYPFVDNLYPESAAVLWGLEDEPDVAREVITVARFLDLVATAQSRKLNASALRGALRGAVGLPAKSGNGGDGDGNAGDELLDHMAEQLFGGSLAGDRVLDALMQLRHDPELADLWSHLVNAAKHMPNFSKAVSELGKVNPAAFEVIRALVFGAPSTTAARRIIGRHSDISIVVLGHSHLPGGAVESIRAGDRPGFYANSGAWVPVTKVRDLQKRGVEWSALSIADRQLFPASFPAIVIEYDGQMPRAPIVSLHP